APSARRDRRPKAAIDVGASASGPLVQLSTSRRRSPIRGLPTAAVRHRLLPQLAKPLGQLASSWPTGPFPLPPPLALQGAPPSFAPILDKKVQIPTIEEEALTEAEAIPMKISSQEEYGIR